MIKKIEIISKAVLSLKAVVGNIGVIKVLYSLIKSLMGTLDAYLSVILYNKTVLGNFR